MTMYEDDAPNVLPWPRPPAPEVDAAPSVEPWGAQLYPDATVDVPDVAPNVMPTRTWRSVAAGYEPDPYSTAALSMPAMPPPQSYYQGAASASETLGRIGQTLNPFNPQGLFGTAYEGDNPILQELARPANYVGVGAGATGLVRGALSGIGGRLAGDAAMEALPEDANPYLRGAVGLGAGLVGGVGGFAAPEVASGAARAARGVAPDVAAGARRFALDETGAVRLGPSDESLEAFVTRKVREGMKPAQILADPEYHALQAKSGFMPDYNAVPEGPTTGADTTAWLRNARVQDMARAREGFSTGHNGDVALNRLEQTELARLEHTVPELQQRIDTIDARVASRPNAEGTEWAQRQAGLRQEAQFDLSDAINRRNTLRAKAGIPERRIDMSGIDFQEPEAPPPRTDLNVPTRAQDAQAARESFASRNPVDTSAADEIDRIKSLDAVRAAIRDFDKLGGDENNLVDVWHPDFGRGDYNLSRAELDQLERDLMRPDIATTPAPRLTPQQIRQRARERAFGEPRVDDGMTQQQAIRSMLDEQGNAPSGAADLPGDYVPAPRAVQVAEQIISEKPDVTPEQAQGLLSSLDLWLKQAESIRNTIPETTHTRLARVAATLSGNLADSYLTALYQRKEWAEAAFKAQGVDEELARRAAQRLVGAELAQRYPNGIPARIQAEIAKTGYAADSRLGKIGEGVTELNQEWKNLAFGPADIGVFGQQFLHGVTAAPGQIIAGTVNRALNLMGGGLETTLLDKRALAKRLQYQLDGVPQDVTTGIVSIDTRQGILGHLGTEKYNVGRAVDASTRFQFGTVLGGLRNLIHEGNLIALHLTGSDITNPRVRATSAAMANSATSWAPRALNAGRALGESATLMTPTMRRAQVASILHMARVFSPQATREERILGSIAILGLASANLAVGKLVANTVGVGEYEFDPSKKDWGRVVTKLTTDNGERVITALFPQQQVASAILKSARFLSEQDNEAAAKEWAKLFMGSSGPVLGAFEKAAGYGYQPGKGYRYGDLKGGLLNVLPLPPIVSSYLQGELKKETAPFEVLGLPAYTEFPSAAVQRGDFDTLKGEQQMDGIYSEGWRRVQQAAPSLGEYKTYSAWREAKRAELTQRVTDELAAKGITDSGEIKAQVNKQADADPVAKAYTKAKADAEIEWVKANPQLTLDLFAKYMDMDYAEQREHPDWNFSEKQRNLARATLALQKAEPVGAR